MESLALRWGTGRRNLPLRGTVCKIKRINEWTKKPIVIYLVCPKGAPFTPPLARYHKESEEDFVRGSIFMSALLGWLWYWPFPQSFGIGVHLHTPLLKEQSAMLAAKGGEEDSGWTGIKHFFERKTDISHKSSTYSYLCKTRF